MVKIDKSSIPIPDILLKAGISETEAFKKEYVSGIRKFKFDNTIYGNASVKKILIGVQNDKCCFCERKISAGEPGHIEHYRPKGGYKKDDKSKLVKPGYYWLVYDFDNLFYCCNRCNSSYKKNYFPLEIEANRATNHLMKIENESPLIISPAEDPTKFIKYKREKVRPFGRNNKGRETIKRTGLNRRSLSDERLDYLKLLDTLAAVARGNGPQSKEAKGHFKRISGPESLFSYMVVCNYPDLV